MNNMKNIVYILLGCIVFAVCGLLTSCSKDDAADKMPVITGVRLIDPALADSTFTECTAGTNIVLMGRNLGSTYEIYINDQKVSFQGTFVTDNNILLTIPSDIKLTGTNPDLKDEIRVVTREGIAVYPFHINAWGCSISSMQANFPLSAGDEIVLYGSNFIDVERVYYTDTDPYATGSGSGSSTEDKEWWEIADEELEQSDTRIIVTPIVETDLEYWVENEGAEMHLILPETLKEVGWIMVKTHTGEASTILYTNASVPVIRKINSDMPIVGSTVKIDGEGFVGILSISIGNNEVVIPASDITISEEETHLEFVMPQAPEKGGTLTIQTIAGSDVIPFYETIHVLADMDGKGGQDWGGAVAVEGDGENPPYVTTGVCLGIDADFNLDEPYWWNAGRLAFNGIVLPSDISSTTDLSKLELRYEGYYAQRFVNVNFKFEFWPEQRIDYQPQSIYTGDLIEGEWATYSIPFQSFVSNASNYGELMDNLAETGATAIFHPESNTSGVPEHVQFYIDNVRIYVNE